ncbi:MAG: SurA N-terminal domain-containing protein, partial [Caulobacterales bacterium]|nr:SurA N-terminal domain-containing protein [Caulobacterales bacterium]
MLSFVRKAARSWVAAVLIGLLVISFAIWGINDVFQGSDKNNVAMVDGKPITAIEYRNEFDRILKRATKESGRQITSKEAREQGADVSTLERMVSENSLLAFMKKIGISIAGTVLKSEIGKIEAFKDPLTKNFSQSTYEQTLAENGLSPKSFEANISSDMGKRLLILAGTSGFRAPKLYASQTLAYGTERRLVTMIPVAAKLAGEPPVPNDAQLKAFYDLNKDKLMRPETRDFTIVIASLDSFAEKATINPAQVKEIFEAQKTKLAQPAKRSFVQIIAKDEAGANEVAKRLKAGENAEEIAKALKLQAPLNFTDATPNQVPDSAV